MSESGKFYEAALGTSITIGLLLIYFVYYLSILVFTANKLIRFVIYGSY